MQVKQFEWLYNLAEAIKTLEENQMRFPSISEWLEILEEYKEYWDDYNEDFSYKNNEIFFKTDSYYDVLSYYTYKRKLEDPEYYTMPVFKSWIAHKKRDMSIKKFILFWIID